MNHTQVPGYKASLAEYLLNGCPIGSVGRSSNLVYLDKNFVVALLEGFQDSKEAIERDRLREAITRALKDGTSGYEMHMILEAALEGRYWSPSNGAGGWMGGGKPHDGSDPGVASGEND